MLDDYSALTKGAASAATSTASNVMSSASNAVSGALGSVANAVSGNGFLGGFAEGAKIGLNSIGSENLSPFVTGLWAKGADNKISAVDIYADPTASVLSNVPAIQSSIDMLSGKLKSVKGMVSNVQNALKIARDLKTTLGAGSVVERLTNSSGLIKSALTLAGVEPTEIMKYVDQTKNLAVMVETGINNAKEFKKDLENLKFSDYKKICDFIGDVTGVEGLHEIVDLGIEIATNTVVLKKYMEAGGDDAGTYNALVANMTDPTTQIQVVDNLLPTVITQSKLYTLRAMNISMGSGVMIGLRPDVIRRFAATFVKPTFSSFEDGKVYYKDMIDTFYEIDPNWNAAIWGKIAHDTDVRIVDVSDLVGASNDFKSMVSSYALITKSGESTVVKFEDKLSLLSTLMKANTVRASMALNFPSVSYNETAVVRS